MTNLFPVRARILSAPSSKRLSGLTCLELRKEIQEVSRKNLRMNIIWNQFMYEVCDRVSKYCKTPKIDNVDKFTPTDISLIFSSFSKLKRNNKKFYNYLLECVTFDIDSYTVRDISVLYNSLTKLNISNDLIFDSLNKIILSKLNNKVSEKDISLLLNAILELKLGNIKEIFINCSLILSSRIKYVSNLHTLTLLLYSYSRLYYILESDQNSLHISDTQEIFIPQNNSEVLGRDDKSNLILLDRRKLMVNDYEHIILTDLTTALLSRCSDLQMDMRPTDLFYFYRSFLNLFFSSEPQKRNVYSNVVRLYKVHNQIMKSLLEFQSRELLILIELLTLSHQIVSESSDIFNFKDKDFSKNEGVERKDDQVNMEIYRNSPSLILDIKNELIYRVKFMSFVDCVNFANFLYPKDHSLDLVFRRISDKLGRENTWESYSNSDILAVIDKVGKRSEFYLSEDMKSVVKVLIGKLPKILKLKEMCSILEVSSVLGVKSNSLESKVATIACRSCSLHPEQVYTIFHSCVSLGYLEPLDSLFEHLWQVKDEKQSIELLLDLAILKFNSLKEVDKNLMEYLKDNIKNVEKYREHLSYLYHLSRDNSVEDSCDTITSPNQEEEVTLDVDFLREKRICVESNQNGVTYEQVLGEFVSEFGDFISNYDPKTTLRKEEVMGGFLFPVVVEIGSKKIGIVPLFEDFYTTNRQMLKLHKFTKLRLLESRVSCLPFDLYQYRKEKNKTNLLANLLQKSYEKLDSHYKTGSIVKITKNETSKLFTGGDENVLIRSRNLNNFERFRSMLSVNV